MNQNQNVRGKNSENPKSSGQADQTVIASDDAHADSRNTLRASNEQPAAFIAPAKPDVQAETRLPKKAELIDLSQWPQRAIYQHLLSNHVLLSDLSRPGHTTLQISRAL